MTADYKSHGRRPEKKPLPGFIWLLTGLAIGLFVALIIYLDKQPENETSFAEAVQIELDKLKQDSAREPERNDEPPANRKEPKFNFYTILPELEVLIPDSELQLGKQPEDRAASRLSVDKQYLLQAGSFKQRQDADRLKAQLALLGMEASIQPVTISRERWFRVRIGPFDDNGDAYRELNRLQQHGISAMAIELKTNR